MAGQDVSGYKEHDPATGPYRNVDDRGYAFGKGPEGQTSMAGYSIYYNNRLEELGIIKPGAAATFDSPDKFNENGTRKEEARLTPLQLAQAYYAQATGQIAVPGTEDMTEEQLRSHRIHLLSNAMNELAKSGGQLSDLAPWAKPKPTNEQMAQSIKDDFPPVTPPKPGVESHSWDGASILEVYPSILRNSGLAAPKPADANAVKSSVNLSGQFDSAKGNQGPSSLEDLADEPSPAPAEQRQQLKQTAQSAAP